MHFSVLIERAILAGGKIHPLVVHFPIVFLLASAVLEAYSLIRRSSRFKNIIFALLVSGALSAAVAAICGLQSEKIQQFDFELQKPLALHRFGGIAVTLLALLFALLYSVARRRVTPGLSRVCSGGLLICACLVGFTAHFGGLLAFGTDYFDDIFASSMRASFAPPLPAKVEYIRDVKPILDRSCANCHANGKQKGGFKTDSRADFLHGGESGSAVKAGHSGDSLMFQLVTTQDSKKVMPKKGQRLNSAEIAVLKRWIDQGLSWNGQNPRHEMAKLPKANVALRYVSIPTIAYPLELDNPIDQLLFAQAEKVGSDLRSRLTSKDSLVDDPTYLRRVSLDLTGLLPSLERRKRFDANRSPDKRIRLVDELLADNPEYAAHWFSFWSDLLRNDYTGIGFSHRHRTEISAWLYQALLENEPYDQFVRDLLEPVWGARGFTKGILWRGKINPSEKPELQTAQSIGQVFMGVNLKCASCHDSFFEDWKLEDTYGLASAFAQRPLQVHQCEKPRDEFVAPRFLYPELGALPRRANPQELRDGVAKLLTSTKNGRFARTMVNRLWARFMGRGIVEPVDELDNSPWNEDLLDWLAIALVTEGYDLKKVMRLIVTSRAYQLPAVPAPTATDSKYKFSGPLVRRLSAEQLLDGISRVGGTMVIPKESEILRYLTLDVLPRFETDRPVSKVPPRNQLARLGPLLQQQEIIVDTRGARNLWLMVISDGKLDPSKKKKDKKKTKKRKTKRVRGAPVVAKRERTEGVKVEWRASLIGPKGEIIPLSSLEPRGAAIFMRRKSKEDNTLVSPALSLVEYQLRAGVADQFNARLLFRPSSINGVPQDGDPSVSIVAMTDATMRAAFLERNSLLSALGRPKRDQIVSRRNTAADTLGMLELVNGQQFAVLLRDAARGITGEFPSMQVVPVMESVYLRALGRLPSTAEEQAVLTTFGTTFNQLSLEDFLWALFQSPEFQLII